MNAAANESNGEEFMRLLNPLDSSASDTVLKFMKPFIGQIESLNVVGENESGGISGASVYAVMRKPDETSSTWVFTFNRNQARWRYWQASAAQYFAWCRIEFRPERGNALIILQTHAEHWHWVRPVKGNEGEFELVGISASGSEAAADADALADRVKKSLDEASLGTTFKIVARAKIPDKPSMGARGQRVYFEHKITSAPYTRMDVDLRSAAAGQYTVTVVDSDDQIIGTKSIIIYH